MLKPSDVEEILRLVDASDFQHVKLKLGDLTLEWRRKGDATALAHNVPAPAQALPQENLSVAIDAAVHADGGSAVPSPMLGVYWHAPRPGDPPFVRVGDRVTRDSLIGIIEVMKLMNTVSAGVDGVVTALVAPNGKGVEFGQTLIRVQVDAT